MVSGGDLLKLAAGDLVSARDDLTLGGVLVPNGRHGVEIYGPVLSGGAAGVKKAAKRKASRGGRRA